MDFVALGDAIATWMRDYAARAGADGYVLGLSGGVDSAVTAALATRAAANFSRGEKITSVKSHHESSPILTN